MQLTPHFNLHHFTASDTAANNGIDNSLPEGADEIRNLKMLAVVMEQFWYLVGEMTSGYRCPELNTLVGGVPNSRHVEGLAVDFTPRDGWTVDEVAEAIEMLDIQAIEDVITYEHHTHIELLPAQLLFYRMGDE